MNNSYRINAIVMGSLLMVTLVLGVFDASFVMPKLDSPLHAADLLTFRETLRWGIFAVFLTALAIVGIAAAVFPLVRRQSEVLAISYVSFRIVECLLLVLGSVLYLFIVYEAGNIAGGGYATLLQSIAAQMKLGSFQLALIVSGIGNTLLCASFYVSRVIPRWLSVWGIIGYVCLFFSAAVALLGIADPTKDIAGLLYVPGATWEFFAFPAWLFFRGFQVRTADGR